jgi:hypothetical protein
MRKVFRLVRYPTAAESVQCKAEGWKDDGHVARCELHSGHGGAHRWGIYWTRGYISLRLVCRATENGCQADK